MRKSRCYLTWERSFVWEFRVRRIFFRPGLQWPENQLASREPLQFPQPAWWSMTYLLIQQPCRHRQGKSILIKFFSAHNSSQTTHTPKPSKLNAICYACIKSALIALHSAKRFSSHLFRLGYTSEAFRWGQRGSWSCAGSSIVCIQVGPWHLYEWNQFSIYVN